MFGGDILNFINMFPALFFAHFFIVVILWFSYQSIVLKNEGSYFLAY